MAKQVLAPQRVQPGLVGLEARAGQAVGVQEVQEGVSLVREIGCEARTVHV